MVDDEARAGFAGGDSFAASDFNEKSIRLGFIRKVYGILSVQLLITVGFICLFMYCEPVKKFSKENMWVYILALVLTLVVIIVLACCENVRRQAPTNFILLAVFTILEGYMLGAVTSHFEEKSVLIAVGITFAVTVALTIFAFQTKWDFTMFGGLLFVLLLILMIFGLLCTFLYNDILRLVYASLGALIFAAYLVFDTQLMMGGKHKYSISPEEYIFAALNLYLDIVNLFLFILSIVQGSRN